MLLIGSFLLLLLIGCTETQLESRFRERVVPEALGDITALDTFGIRYFDEGAIVVFTGTDSQLPVYPNVVGYAVFRKDLAGWRARQQGRKSRGNADLSGKLIDYSVSDFNYETTGAVVIFGHRLLFGDILSSMVEVIEVELDDGTLLQDDGSGDVFAFSVTADHSFCKLRMFDAQGNLLESITPEYEPSPYATHGPEC